MTWTEKPKLLLGLEISRNREAGTLTISQKQLAKSVLNEFEMDGCAPTRAPMIDLLPDIDKDEPRNPDTSIPYLVFIGKVNYLARGTRPDLSFAVSHLASFCSVYQQPQWIACKHLMRYLKGTLDTSITYYKDPSAQIVGYSDADWANDRRDRRSMSGYIFTHAGGPISWNSKKQPLVTRSSTEAEYVALDSALREALWWRSLKTELGIETNTTTIYEDNQAAIKLSKNPITHNRSKHIDVKYHAIREAVENGQVELLYLETKNMLADCMTKPLNGSQLRHLGELMGLTIKSDQLSSSTRYDNNTTS